MISVIVPIYNVEKYLKQCVDSILVQTYSDIEVILIDDGSTDCCGEICDEYSRIDARVQVFHTKNSGLSSARNLGLKVASGEYIGFVDADDWIEPEMYESLLRELQLSGADISVCGTYIDFVGYRLEQMCSEREYTCNDAITALLFDQIYDYTWNKLYKRDCWEGIWFPEGHVYEDVATTYKVLVRTNKVISTSKCLYHYRQREISITKSRCMSNLVDYWNSYYQEYVYLSDVVDEKRVYYKLLEKLASAAAKTWRWVYIIPKQDRNYEYLNYISCFVKENMPKQGKKNWPAHLRITLFFVRYVNETSFTVVYFLNRIYGLTMKRKRNLKYLY